MMKVESKKILRERNIEKGDSTRRTWERIKVEEGEMEGVFLALRKVRV